MVNSSCDSGSNPSLKNEFRLQYLQITSLSVQKSKFSATKTALFSFQNSDVAGMRGAFFRGVGWVGWAPFSSLIDLARNFMTSSNDTQTQPQPRSQEKERWPGNEVDRRLTHQNRQGALGQKERGPGLGMTPVDARRCQGPIIRLPSFARSRQLSGEFEVQFFRTVK